MRTIRELIRYLESEWTCLSQMCEMGPPDVLPDGVDAGSYYLELDAAETVEECRRAAAQFGCELIGQEVGLMNPREALVQVGKLLAWARTATLNGATLTVIEAAELLRVNRDKVLGWIAYGRLKASNVGQGVRPRWRVSQHDLDAFLAGHTNRPPTKPKRLPVGDYTHYYPEC